MRVLGAILAGGLSSRFGSDKAAALLDGRTLLERTVATLAPQVDTMVLCGRAGECGLPGIPDRPDARLGPLGGLNAALQHAASHGIDQVLSVPCDVPDLPADIRAQLSGAGRCSLLADLPVIGWWPAALGPALDRWLAGGEPRAVRRWAAHVGAATVKLARPLANINRPEDLERLCAG